MGLHKWLKRKEIPTQKLDGKIFFQFSDLPAPERRAYLEFHVEQTCGVGGVYDDVVDEIFIQALAFMRETAEIEGGNCAGDFNAERRL